MSLKTILRHPHRRILLFAGVLLPAFCGSIRAQEAQVSILCAFHNTHGAAPGAPILGGDGNFYGVTGYGGVYGNYGTVYRVAPDGTLTDLHDFDFIDGETPNAPLLQASDGNLYGITAGGSGTKGTVFRIDTAGGGFTVLHRFTGADGQYPSGGLIQGSDGSIYGVTENDGVNDFGSIFRITTTGVLTVLHAFDGTDGTDPQGALLQGSGGNFYGTTTGSLSTGSDQYGTVYRITPAGALTVLHRFDGGTEGSVPESALIQARDGNFYGTTTSGGANGDGTIFRITSAGVLTVLHSFDGTDGRDAGALIQASDGYLYGATFYGGANDDGTVYRITTASDFKTLYTFDGSVEAGAYSPLLQGPDGAFYGSTYFTEGGNYGVLYRLTLSVMQFSPASYAANEAAGSVAVQVERTGDRTNAAMVRYATADGSALAGRDYKASSGTLSWAAGDASARTITVGLLDPGVQYGDRTRTFSVGLSAPTGEAAIGAGGPASVIIAGTTDRPVITSALTASADAGTPFSYQITAANGAAAYGVSGLPPGLSVDANTGLISGTLMKTGTVPLALHAYSAGGIGSATLTLTVQAAGLPIISSAATADGAVGAAFSYQIVASGHPSSYGVQGLPEGLSINAATGLLSGTPAVAGTYTLTLNAANSVGQGAATLTLAVQTQGTPLVTSAGTATGTVGTAFSYQIAATNHPTVYGVQGLVGGLTIDANTGLISGTPKFAGTFTLTFNAYNSAGRGSATFTLTVAAP